MITDLSVVLPPFFKLFAVVCMVAVCRTVSDAVHALDAIVGYDALDAKATRAASKYIPRGGYRQFLNMDGLRGKRIGIVNVFFHGTDARVLKVYGAHLGTARYGIYTMCPPNIWISYIH
jgi:Asp-tRNA(Asn)/Glu-tRNA(Gln) amidotransferase A subunit family amidase